MNPPARSVFSGCDCVFRSSLYSFSRRSLQLKASVRAQRRCHVVRYAAVADCASLLRGWLAQASLPHSLAQVNQTVSMAAPTAGGSGGAGAAPTARVMFLYSNPLFHKYHRDSRGRPKVEEMDELDINVERRKIKAIIKDVCRDRRCCIRWAEQVATVPNFNKALQRGCQVLHFTGHGLPAAPPSGTSAGHEAMLTFENDVGEMFPISGATLTKLFETNDRHTQVRCVFVSACHSGDVGKAFADAGVPHVVAVKTSTQIEDKASIQFAEQFYNALLRGSTVGSSFKTAYTSVSTEFASTVEAKKFVLLGKGDHDTARLFESVPPGTYQDDSKLGVCDNHGREPTDHLVGRGLDVSRCLAQFKRKARVVSIVGMAGIGKTEVARKVAEFASIRRIFDAIYFVELGRDGGVESGWDGLVRNFAAAYGKEVDPEDFEESLRRKFSSESDELSLTVVDGADMFAMAEIDAKHAYMHGRDAKMLPVFLSNVASKAGSMRFLVTTSTPLGTVGSISERIVRLEPLSHDYIAEILIKSMGRDPMLSEVDDVGVNQGHPRFYRQFLQAVARSPVVRALEGHAGATKKVAELLTQTRPGAALGTSPYYKLNDPEVLREKVPAIRERFISRTGRAFARHALTGGGLGAVGSAGGAGGPPPGGLSYPMSGAGASAHYPGPERLHFARTSDKLPDAVSDSVEMLRRTVRDEQGVQFWMAAATATARRAAKPRHAAPSPKRSTRDDIRVGLKPTPSTESGGWGGRPAAASLPEAKRDEPAEKATTDEEELARASMPPAAALGGGFGPSWSTPGALSSTTPAAPPSRPKPHRLQRHAQSAYASPEDSAELEEFKEAAEPLAVDFMMPLPWESIASELKDTFQRHAGRAARQRPIGDEELSFIRSSARLAMVSSDGTVTVQNFAARWPALKEWLATMALLADDWAVTSPGKRIWGWLSRDGTDHLLRSSPVGTFVFRFSDSTPSQLVMGLVRDNGSGAPAAPALQLKVAILPREDGRPGYRARVPTETSPGRPPVYTDFDSLSEFLAHYRVARWLFPAFPKETAFDLSPRK